MKRILFITKINKQTNTGKDFFSDTGSMYDICTEVTRNYEKKITKLQRLSTALNVSGMFFLRTKFSILHFLKASQPLIA